MIDLSLLTDGGVGWLDASGPSSHLVLSTRIRLARNLAGRVFQGRTSETEREDILSVVESAARESVLLRQATKFRLDRLERTERQLLHERHLVSKELAGLDADGRVRSGASLLVQDRIGVMLNEEDHLRIQGLHSGFALEATYAEVDRLDAELGQRLAFAFHPEFGYLTSCPTNVGTGLRASVLIHLPGLVLTKEISKVLQGLAQVGLTFRGLYGEGSEVVGNFFQLSNQTTLGSSEHELLDHLGKMVRQVMDYE
jgi:protein arginine kinase